MIGVVIWSALMIYLIINGHPTWAAIAGATAFIDLKLGLERYAKRSFETTVRIAGDEAMEKAIDSSDIWSVNFPQSEEREDGTWEPTGTVFCGEVRLIDPTDSAAVMMTLKEEGYIGDDIEFTSVDFTANHFLQLITNAENNQPIFVLIKIIK